MELEAIRKFIQFKANRTVMLNDIRKQGLRAAKGLNSISFGNIATDFGRELKKKPWKSHHRRKYWNERE